MPTYKLHYFNARGFGEMIRIMFKVKGVAFEDVRYERDTTWPAAKEKMPYGLVPVLEIDGKTFLTQGFAIARYIARQFGFMGSNEMEAFRIDEFTEMIRDLLRDMLATRYEQDSEKKKALETEFATKKVPNHMKNFEKFMTNTPSKDGFLVGGTLSLADIVLINVLSWLPSDVLDKYPKIKSHKDKIEAIPAIARWIKERPATSM